MHNVPILHKLLMEFVCFAFQSTRSHLCTPLVPTWSRAQLVFVSKAVPVTPTVPMAENVAPMVVGAPVRSQTLFPITTCQPSSALIQLGSLASVRLVAVVTMTAEVDRCAAVMGVAKPVLLV